MKRLSLWIGLAVLAAAAAVLAVRFFPKAFSIVALDLRMDRDRALEEARAIAAREGFGPDGYRQAASFTLDSEAQTFIELEGGGKDTFTHVLRHDLYSAYTWRVRHFREGETNETTFRFTPEGKPYGFVETLREDAPGAALDAAAAKQIAEAGAARWNVDLARFELIEQGQERRVGKRVDHTLAYERPTPTLNAGRYRLRLVVSGDRLTEITYFVQIPEAFTRRYAAMRSANDAIGTASVVGMALLYILGGIGVGLFYLLRKRWVVWRPAALWGAAIGLLQGLSMVNDLPLQWMAYDTAVARSTFLAEYAARVVAAALGFSTFFALSFIAAESLTRRAFGDHPQLWRAWSARSTDPAAGAPGASREMLGRTLAGYLLVPIFLAYVVMFYFVAVGYLGWWSPSEALLHPDVLATYVPWLSAIANSLQAGFWEEALFRAVPLAGAALIGDRFGQRRLFLIVAFVVQAMIFGAGHAQYPGQPAYARPAELILPSIGFGLLYLYYGLVPAIVLHFTFDVVLFALPIFVAQAPGIRLQQAMVVLMALVPLWVVLYRRLRAGRWTVLSPADRNGAWVPPATEHEPVAASITHDALSPAARTRWLVIGGVAALACIAIVVMAARSRPQSLPVRRLEAAGLVRQALASRGVTLDRQWRFLAVPDNGANGPHEFVSSTAGETRRRELVGHYLPAPRWRVRLARFEGDVADRAEEWSAYVTPAGEVRGIRHDLPEARPGATLDEHAARQLARQAVADRFGLVEARGDVREISAQPTRLQARTDWTFIFVDTTVPPLARGEPRVSVLISGHETAAAGRLVYVPEEWERQMRAADTRNLILRIFGTMVFAGLLLGAAVSGIIAWSRDRYTPRLFVASAVLMLVLSVAKSANSWPMLLAALQTDAPLELQILGVVGIGLVGLILSGALVGLALGAMPHRLVASASMDSGNVLKLGLAVGAFAAVTGAAAAWLRTPDWARNPYLDPAGAMSPLLQAAIDPLTRVLMASTVMLAALTMVEQITTSWTRRKAVGLIALILVGFAAGGVPVGLAAEGWLAAGAVTAAALTLAYVTLLRFDLTMVPIAIATMVAVSALAQGAQRAFPFAFTGSLIAAGVSLLIGWLAATALRRARTRVEAGATPATADVV